MSTRGLSSSSIDPGPVLCLYDTVTAYANSLPTVCIFIKDDVTVLRFGGSGRVAAGISWHVVHGVVIDLATERRPTTWLVTHGALCSFQCLTVIHTEFVFPPLE